MRNGNQMLTGAIKQACARVCAAAALICGLLCSSAFVAGAPQMAFADMDAGATPRVQEEGQASVLVGDAVRLTRLSDASVLVELMNADEQTTVSLGLEALNATGASLGGSVFTFTPETRGLPTAHAVPNGDGLTIVVSNGVHAISSSGPTFALGTLALPEGAAKVAVTSLTRIGAGGAEGTLEGTGPNLGELALAQSPESGGEPSNTQNTSNTTNKDDSSNTQEPGGDGDNGGNGGNNGGPNGGDQGGGKDMPQTGDGQVIDASAFLLLAGGAALIAAVILILRRRSQKSQRDEGM